MVATGTIGDGSAFGNMGANAAAFPGNTSDYLACGPLLSSPWTVAGWFYSSGISFNQGIWGQGTASAPGQQILWLNNSKLGVMVDGVHFDAGSTTLVSDTWYHAATTYDGTTVNVYLDGSDVPEISATRTAVYTSALRFALGLWPSINEPLSGLEVGVGVWDKVTTGGEIGKLWNGDEGQQWPFTLNP